MGKVYLVDTFAGEIIPIEKRDKFAAPERYFEISSREDDLDIYTDTYWVDMDNELVIDFSYSYDNSWNIDYSRWYNMLYNHLESHGLERKEYQLKHRRYPKERFKRLCEQYGQRG